MIPKPKVYPAIGTAIFEKLFQRNIYIDKTELIYQILTGSDDYYFLSRPRRFGKSLLVSTFKSLFLGKRELFKGLWIDSVDYDWLVYPVIHLDFGSLDNLVGDRLEKALTRKLELIVQEYEIDFNSISQLDISSTLNDLIMALKYKYKMNVVILIDEYDRPVLNVLEDSDNAESNRKIIAAFFNTIKTNGEHLRFVFLTGVSKLAKASVFSALNNLVDLSMKEEFATLLGYTSDEIEKYFSPHIAYAAEKLNLSVEEFLEKLKLWYNGYRFSKSEKKVYNPVACHNCLHNCEFGNYWFATATPTFLIKIIQKQLFEVQNFESGVEIGIELFEPYDTENIPLVPLLYQTGYLTIQEYIFETETYTIGYPNYEVSHAFEKHLAIHFLNQEASHLDLAIRAMIKSLQSGEIENFLAHMQELFSQIPYNIQIASETYYHSLFYLICRLLNIRISVEVETNQGRVDAVINLPKMIYLFEFKFQKDIADDYTNQKLAEKALQQIKEHHYYQSFIREKKPLTCIGVVFSFPERNITTHLIEKYLP